MEPTDWIGACGGIVGVLVAIAALGVAGRANSRSTEANRIAQNAFNRESLVDERQREFRSVEWKANVSDNEITGQSSFELRNVGDTAATNVTIVLHLHPEKEPHRLGDIPAKGSAIVSSDPLTQWMLRARDHDVVCPGFRVHWSSPLGQASDEIKPMLSVDDFVDWSLEDE